MPRRSSASAIIINLPGASPEQLAEIGELKGKLEEAEAALQSADQEAQALHLQLQQAEARVAAAERAADEAAEAMEVAHQRVCADVATLADVAGQTVRVGGSAGPGAFGGGAGLGGEGPWMMNSGGQLRGGMPSVKGSTMPISAVFPRLPLPSPPIPASLCRRRRKAGPLG